MQNPFAWLATAAILVSAASAAIGQTTTTTSQSDLFDAKVFVASDGGKLPYRLLSPLNRDPAAKYPLVVFLHGSGECGNDNVKQLLKGVRKMFANDEARKNYPCFFVLPQCPAGGSWTDGNYWGKDHTQPAKPSPATAMVLELVESMSKQPGIAADRVYLFGLSMGGYGAWDMACRRPDLFAAAMPICGGGDEADAKKLVNLPVWAFHGTNDANVPVARSRDMIKAIQDAGGKPKYSEYPDTDHKVWNKAFAEADFLPWMFAQRRGATSQPTTRPAGKEPRT